MRALLLLTGIGSALPCGGVEILPPCALAREQVQALARAWGGEAEVRCLNMLVRIPAEARWRAGPLPRALRAGPVNWPLEWHGPTGWNGSMQPLVVRWSLPVPVTRARLPAHHVLQDSDLQMAVQVLPPGFSLPPLAETGLQGRLRRALPEGALVSAADFLAPDSLPMGHVVNVVLRQRGLELRLPGRLVAPARLGSDARVQLIGRREVLQGHVLDAKTLIVENEG